MPNEVSLKVRHAITFENLFKSFLVFFLFPTYFFSQQKNLPLNRESFINFDRMLSRVNTDTLFLKYNHSVFKPMLEFERDEQKSKHYTKMLKKKLFQENLIIIKDTAANFCFTIDPLFHYEFGKDSNDNTNATLYKNTRGLLLRGDITKKISFETSFYENQATFVQYINNFNNTFKVVPGQGRWKNFKNNGYDYAMASGYMSYSPNNHFNFQVGHGKHFIGEGYRSLLLSDNSFNYPYTRITASYKKIQYSSLYAVLMNLTSGKVKTPAYTESLFQKKAASFHLLSWNINQRIQLGCFQGLIWRAADENNKQNLNVNYFNPLLFSNAFIYSFNHTNNVLLGATFKVKLNDQVSIYGQWLIDDLIADSTGKYRNNKEGYQLGVKALDLFKIKNLYFLSEYNQVFPYTYAHKKTEQAYTHYNQALAHPLGANFKEVVSLFRYQTRNFYTEVKFNYILSGADSSGKNFGSDIFKSDNIAYYGLASAKNEFLQGAKRTVIYKDIKIGYLINPATNLSIMIGVTNRVEKIEASKFTTNFMYIGIRTSLTNVYYDF